MSTQAAAYLEANKQSYANQEGGVTIPAEKLDYIVEIPLGFQPLGICSRSLENADEIAIADYFGPAVCLAQVHRDEQGLHFRTSWIRGADYGDKSVRLFPDIFEPGGANRAQTVNFESNGALWVSRNGERDFFILISPGSVTEARQLVGRVTMFERGFPMIHSALLHNGVLLTIESTGDLNNWEIFSYRTLVSFPVAAYQYGLAYRNNNTSTLWVVTDFRSTIPHGIYRAGDVMTPVVPDVEGTGICFLQDGSALVSRYGQGDTSCFNGVPGALIYVPSHLFEK